MRFSTRNASGQRGARLVVSGVLVCCLGVACSNSGEPARQNAGPGRAATARAATGRAATTSPTAAARSTAKPATTPGPNATPTIKPEPDSRDATTLARGLDDAATTLRDNQPTAAAAREAGEFQQLAVRNLVTSSADFRRTVIGQLDPRTARDTRAQVRASQALATISDPRFSLPKWRVVAPAPRDRLLHFYRDAQRRTGVDWTYLAAIQLIETRMGRIRGTSSAGAQGPMQFTRQTWQVYGDGGNINDNHDSILAAARLLKAYGAPADMDAALWHYNPAAGYVRAVDAYAQTMRTSVSAFDGYWQWQVIYSYQGKSFVLPVGYPGKPAVRLHG